MADNSIIIKKIKKGGHGHHGGAWKIAYADFVTAMMAFFLLMWLLNATEAENLAGLADYFAPTVGIKGQMGIGFRGGKSALSKGIGADKNTNRGIVFGGVPAGPVVKVAEKIEISTDEPDAEKIAVMIGGAEKSEEQQKEEKDKLAEIEKALENYVKEIANETGAKEMIDLINTPEGLEIQIRDTAGESMFEGTTADLRPKTKMALQKMSEIISKLPNYISITGHTNSVPVKGRENYGNWELSADRANATRRFLLESGVQPEQISRVIGKSDNEPLDVKQPEAPVNSRISIVLLRDALLPQHKKSAPDGVFLDPASKEAKDLIKEEKKPEQPKEELKKEEAKPHVDIIKDVKEQEEKDRLEIENPDKKDVKPVTESEDPFSGGIAPDKLFADEEKGEKKVTKPVKSYLFEEDKDDGKDIEEFKDMPVQDPFKGSSPSAPPVDIR